MQNLNVMSELSHCDRIQNSSTLHRVSIYLALDQSGDGLLKTFVILVSGWE
ncbi:hypothetical protein ACRRTK_006184 [Alexandromys fortis]